MALNERTKRKRHTTPNQIETNQLRVCRLYWGARPVAKRVCFFLCLFSSIRFDSIRYSVVYAHGLMQCLSFCLSCLFSFKSNSSSSGYSSRFLICVLIVLIRSRMVRTVYTQVNRLRSLLRSYASWYMSWFFLSFFLWLILLCVVVFIWCVFSPVTCIFNAFFHHGYLIHSLFFE